MIQSDDTINRLMWDLGETLIIDDKDDLGYFSYKGRNRHRYHGQNNPNHPLPFHHWQAGVMLLGLSQILTLASLARDVKEVAEEESTF